MSKRRQNNEFEKPMGTGKTALMVLLPIIAVALIILIIALVKGWIKYPFGF